MAKLPLQSVRKIVSQILSLIFISVVPFVSNRGNYKVPGQGTSQEMGKKWKGLKNTVKLK